MSAAGGGNIKVVVRVRPFNSRETDRNAQCIVQMRDGQTIISPPTGEHRPKGNKASLDGAKTFKYDKSYWSFDKNDPNFAGQENLHDDLGKPLLDNAFQGYNNCIFAYGQTGSGKSYSMMGYGADAGVIPRICKDMFDRIQVIQQDPNAVCTVEVSYLEIYNERVRDLLNPATKGNLKVREHPSTGPYVEDLAKLIVRSFSEIENLMDEGNKARTVAATNMNETSSRSHAVFTLTLTQKRRDMETKMDMERVAKISLVDLAGSERATSTGATGARLKEGAEINRSLSTLGRVIAALADVSTGKKKNASSLVPYRDSILTWLLKDSLGGNSMTAMIAAISPADINFEETLSTLRYADSAKRIKNHAVVNEDANARMIRELKEELAQLRSKLSGGGSSGAVGSVDYPPDTPLDQQMVSLTQADGTSRQVSKAEIAEQLSQSEKLYQDLNQTWEQKLQKTEEIHKEREAALEELGISIDKGFVGVSTPKKMPHLVNLSDDPLLAECLIYNLKPGNTTVGNDEMTTTAEIRLKGSKILQEHCVFENKDGIVSIIPNDEAAVMVNGMRVDQAKRLHSGYRVILGDFHIFRFNHPQEARAERAEQGSLLRQSMTADEIDSPSTRKGHDRNLSTFSRQESEFETDGVGVDSPRFSLTNEHDYDWSFARREAATAILGTDQKIANLTDEELDVLFDDLQRVRANRRGIPDRIQEREEDTDSQTSYPVREKYMSSATLDNFSMDTALTAPSTPPHSEDTDRRQVSRDSSQSLLDKRKADHQAALRSIEGADDRTQDAEIEKAKVQQNIEELKLEMERQLKEQQAAYELKIEQLRSPKVEQPKENQIGPHQKALARQALQKWRGRKYVRMAGVMLRNASTLKEAQILTQKLGKTVSFQYAIIDANQTLDSSYDLVLNGPSDEDDDELYTSPKPCICIRIVDFKAKSIYLWSMEKLERRIHQMRQMQQYLNRPEYMQHFRVSDPFSNSCLPQFSRIGEAQVSLNAVFESRVQDYAVDVISPYTFNVIAILKLSLEPSLAEAPDSVMKFNVVLHDMVGFTEIEGTDVHAQLFLQRITEEEGATTTALISGFNEGPVQFESLHGMSLPSTSTRDSCLRIAIFARVAPMHLDKLLSWDDMRDSARRNSREQSSRLAETEYFAEEKHDVFTQVQILELSEIGEYEPVEVEAGSYQLRQGLQRRVVIKMTHTCGKSLPWSKVHSLRAGQIRLLDSTGQVPDLSSPQPNINIEVVEPYPIMKENADGTTNVTLVGQWDSSAHRSLLLDRTTKEKYRVQLSLQWTVSAPKLTDPMDFSLDVVVQIRPRALIRAQSMLSPLLSQIFVQSPAPHSTTGIFSISIKPPPVKSTMDLWRMDTKYDYVKGEDFLTTWTPRGVSLIRDYINYRKKQVQASDVEVTKSVFSTGALTPSKALRSEGKPFSEKEKDLVNKALTLWTIDHVDPSAVILNASHINPPRNGAAFAAQPVSKDRGVVSATVLHRSKNPSLLKSGQLLMPDPGQQLWSRKYLELRKPFLHIHSIPDGDEENAINLSDARIDHQPQVAKLLKRSNKNNGALKVFAIYARQNAYLFATTSEREKLEWVMRLDESYFDSPKRSSPDSSDS